MGLEGQDAQAIAPEGVDFSSLELRCDFATTFYPLSRLSDGEYTEYFDAYFTLGTLYGSETPCVNILEAEKGLYGRIHEGNQGYAEARKLADAQTFTKDGSKLKMRVQSLRGANPHEDSYAFVTF